MRVRGRASIRPALRSAFRVEGLEDRRLLSGLIASQESPDFAKGVAIEVQTTSGTRGTSSAVDVPEATSDTAGGGRADTSMGATDRGAIDEKALSDRIPTRSDLASGEVESASPTAGSWTAARPGFVGTLASRAQLLSAAATSPSAGAATSAADDAGLPDETATTDPIEATSPDGPSAETVTTAADGASGGDGSSGSGAGSSEATSPASVASDGLPRSSSVQSPPGDGSATAATDSPLTTSPPDSEIVQAMSVGRQTAPASPRLVRNGPMQSDVDGRLDETLGADGPSPSPQTSDLLTNFLPFDRASLEQAIDRFLVGFETIGEELTGAVPTTHMVPALAAVAISAVAIEVVRRKKYAQSLSRPLAQDEEDLARAFAHPTHWRFGEI